LQPKNCILQNCNCSNTWKYNIKSFFFQKLQKKVLGGLSRKSFYLCKEVCLNYSCKVFFLFHYFLFPFLLLFPFSSVLVFPVLLPQENSLFCFLFPVLEIFTFPVSFFQFLEVIPISLYWFLLPFLLFPVSYSCIVCTMLRWTNFNSSRNSLEFFSKFPPFMFLLLASALTIVGCQPIS